MKRYLLPILILILILMVFVAGYFSYRAEREEIHSSENSSASSPSADESKVITLIQPEKEVPINPGGIGYLRRPPMSKEDSLAAEPFFPNGVDEYGEPIDSESLPKPPSELAALLETIGDLQSLSDQELDDLLDHFRTWGRAGTGQAILYALDGLEGESRLDLAVAAFEGWAEKDIAAAADYVGSLTTSGSDFVNFAVPERYVAHDPVEAADWALNRTSTLFRNYAVQHTIIEWNRGKDGSESATWLAGHLAERDRLQLYEKTAVREVTETLARQDLDTAREFINSLDSLEGQQAGVSVLIDHWANEDLENADRWLEDLVSQAGSFATDGTYDEAYRVMAFRIVDHDVEAAQRWINRISDDSDYDSILNQLGAKLDHSQ